MPFTHRTRALVLVAGLLTVSTLFAQSRKTESELRGGESPYTVRVSDVIGATVVNGDNVELGTVDDIVIVRTSGELDAIISTGGLLGIGDALYAIGLDELKAGSTDERVFLDMSETRFQSRPQFHYVEGESSGQKIWEKRLALKKQIEKKRKDVRDERDDILEIQEEIRKLERRLDELKRQ